MADVIAVLSLKGGTGKTTAVRTLAAAFTEYAGLGVLAVDLDPQGNLSDYFDVPSDAAPTIADVLTGKATLADAIHDGVVPSSPALSEVERELAGRMGRELVLRRALEPVRDDYDVILLDCPPALGLLAVNGVVAADWALFSSEAQYFAVQGVQTALDVVQQAKEVYSPGLQWLGIVMNIADMRTRHSRDAYDQLAEHYPERVFETVVRSSIAYAESAEQARSILETRPDLGTDYLSLGAEVLERIGRGAPARKLRRAVAS
jgi:chromosome partitioning protein